MYGIGKRERLLLYGTVSVFCLGMVSLYSLSLISCCGLGHFLLTVRVVFYFDEPKYFPF